MHVPTWMPDEARKVLLDSIDRILNAKGMELDPKVAEAFHELYQKEAERISFFAPLFTDKKLKKTWGRLSKVSTIKTEKFVRFITSFNFYSSARKIDIGGQNLVLTGSREMLSTARVLSCYLATYEGMISCLGVPFIGDEYKTKFSTEEYQGHKTSLNRLIKKLSDINKNLAVEDKNPKKKSRKYLSGFKKGKAKVENPEAVFMIRTFSVFFRENFNRSFNDVVAEFVNTLFGTNYVRNDITKLTADIRDSIKRKKKKSGKK